MTGTEPIISFERSGMRFAVHQEQSGTLSFVGYCDGERSVTASRGDIAARALIRKHIIGLREGKLIDLQAARKRSTAP